MMQGMAKKEQRPITVYFSRGDNSFLFSALLSTG